MTATPVTEGHCTAARGGDLSGFPRSRSSAQPNALCDLSVPQHSQRVTLGLREVSFLGQLTQTLRLLGVTVCPRASLARGLQNILEGHVSPQHSETLTYTSYHVCQADGKWDGSS